MKQSKKKIAIIYTGGTIGMERSENGYTPSPNSLQQTLEGISDLRHPDMPEWSLLEFSPLLDSSNMAVHEWNKIGQAVANLYELYDGFVILHGTDTMAYSASALSFMLDGLAKPVIFTGSQIPLCELRSDGRDNIINSLIIAGSGRAREVCVYFNGVLLRGNRSTKQSSDHLLAFESPNYPHLAEAGIDLQYRDEALRQPGDAALNFLPFSEVPIGVIKVFPGIQFELFESIMTDKLKGVVLETFGAGNIPSYGGNLLPIIQKAYNSGTIVTVCSQCMQGTVSLGAYATSKALHDIGAVNGKDMTTEAALTKLYYLFSLGLPKEEIKEKMAQNLRGELTE
ncbi:MAG: asparaginase [Oscillospiraceae bacterium]|jgi:L-asparaginase|nr:asparaginase [Oscillospiraceae bacterium]